MAQAAKGQWVNGDGLLVKFGEYYRDPQNFVNRSRLANTLGPNRTIEMDVDVSVLTAGSVSYTTDLSNAGNLTGFNIGDVAIPAYAVIRDVYFVVNTAFAGGTSIQVGLYKADGTALDASGLMTATEGAVANFNATGNKIVGAGTYTATTAGTADWGGHNAYIGLKVNGTYTAGTGRLVVTYLETNLAPTNLA